MPELTAVIVDDEIYGQQNLSQMLARHCPYVKVLGIAGNVLEASRLIKKACPTIVFLDVQMPGGDGFTLLDHRKSTDFSVIVVSAHADYGIQAVKASAIDYLLKPIRSVELIEAVEKVREKSQPIADVLPSNSEKITIPHAHGVSLIAINEIEYLEADNMYTTLHMTDGRVIVVSRAIKEFESVLPGDRFFRIHKSFMINLDRLVDFQRHGGVGVTLSCGKQLPVSRRRIVQFHDALSSYAAAL